MSFYRPPTIDEEPMCFLHEWKIYRVTSPLWEGTSDHAVGFSSNDRAGRVCSPIQSVDKLARIVVTRSGRQYKLEGVSGYSPDGHYVWNRWCYHNQIVSIIDVTNEYELEEKPVE